MAEVGAMMIRARCNFVAINPVLDVKRSDSRLSVIGRTVWCDRGRMKGRVVTGVKAAMQMDLEDDERLKRLDGLEATLGLDVVAERELKEKGFLGMRKTKFVCTIGPACCAIEDLEKLALEGMNIARLNMCHNTKEWHYDVIRKIKKLNEKGFCISVMIDTEGSQIHVVDHGAPSSVKVEDGSNWLFTAEKFEGSRPFTVQASYEGFSEGIQVGDSIVIDGGMASFEVMEKIGNDLSCKCTDPGLFLPRAKCSFWRDGRLVVRKHESPTLSNKVGKCLMHINIHSESFTCDDADIVRLEFPFSSPLKIFKTCRLGRGFHTLVKNASPLQYGISQSTLFGASVLTGTRSPLQSMWDRTSQVFTPPQWRGHDDWSDIEFGISEGVDFIALSFVSSAESVKHLKSYLSAKSAKSVRVLAKIESLESLQNLEEIIKASDGIMVARGDLGVEIPLEQIPAVQEEITSVCRELNKPVIVASQLLESMVEYPTPTRAEVADVSEAVRQYADALMLCGESAIGSYGQKALSVLQIASSRMELWSREENRKHFLPQHQLGVSCTIALPKKFAILQRNWPTNFQ